MQTLIITSENKESRDAFITENYKLSEIDGNSMLIESEGGKKISIAQARELIKFASLRPLNSTQKVAIIKDAQLMTVEAQNSLLKLIEEPPEYLQIVLSVDNPKNLIDTVLSRCIITRIKNPQKSSTSFSSGDSFDEFIEVISMDIGERFDWFSSSKSKFKDRVFAVEFLKNWQMFLRNMLLDSLGKNGNSINLSTKACQENLIYLMEVVEKIRSNNANVSMGIESFLINFPIISK
ncbi:hypothetical protein CO058_00435 [candidate division WWE3 bacterium CG_4_9_14_0_2_um_filter_35_11]|uniref:DNA polymerase III subunit delta n=1 Tax=candidate division WWE3 bacterium CG_4_9_14_0_2_um_filter_35_11 TaxID=1975077 RepID=A0A2M8EMN7_UNCKA|nr:MAG: hypothetical protein COV25_01615 [candidate division WWE3 bacterium CG10_big_fil_rev_8_21_14_0_10_35_32]PJC24006.1 MAG: hypothetical protein CO058_00435 [candidate division WWE3 bacterium CG_4_9_14_0_2_um_filter_35_11]